ncbi:hypothetical protein ACA910_018961 [Epithemia clementina (nom. ined.)]
MFSQNLTTGGLPEKRSGGAFSCIVYGEKTSLPIEVRKALVRITEKPVVYLNQALVLVELNLVNTAVQKDHVSAKLHLTLPVTASVRRFELCRAGEKKDGVVWFPATAVPKKKAAQVVYQEKEKRRAVAAVSNSAAASNVFEMEISPMPFEQIVQCRLEIMVQGDELQEIVNGLFPKDSSIEVTVEKVPQQGQKSSDNSAGAAVPHDSGAGAVVGTCFGKTHFCCKIPGGALTQITTKADGGLGMRRIQNTIRRMAIFQDTSASMMPTKEQTANRETRLHELLLTAGAPPNGEGNQNSSCEEIVVELFTFDILGVVPHGVYSNAHDVVRALDSMEYNGGTNLGVLKPAISELANRVSNKIDCVLIGTDGVDVTSTKTTAIDSSDTGPPVSFPVYCIADGDAIHVPNLRHLAAICPHKPGNVLTKQDHSYLPGILYPDAFLRRIRTNQDEESFVEEIDDGFRCVPDHRLAVPNQPISTSQGIVIAGILNANGENDQASSVTEIVAEVVVGGKMHEFYFQIGNPGETNPSWNGGGSESTKEVAKTIHQCPTYYLNTTKENTALVDPARILGHLYADEVYRQTELDRLKSGMDHKSLLQAIAVEYGFCSPESSLLMLYEKEQFVEYGIAPPVGHPPEMDLRTHFESERKNDASKIHDGTKSIGEIGGLKNEKQRDRVKKLANDLNYFFASTSDDVEPMMLTSGAPRRSRENGSREDGPFMAAEYIVERSRMVRSATLCSQQATTRSNGAARRMAAMMTSAVTGVSRSADSCASNTIEREADHTARRNTGVDPNGLSASATTKSPPKPAEDYLQALTEALESKDDSATTESWKEVYDNELASYGGHKSASPSLFLNTARVLAKMGKTDQAIKIATNCLESGIDNVQMLRSVGYVLLSTSTAKGSDLAISVFDKIKEIEPSEPQSYIDSSLARFQKSYKIFHSFTLRNSKGSGERTDWR